MINRLILTIFIITLFNGLNAQNSTPPHAGARGLALGDASVAFSDIHASFSNQAGLAFLDGMAFTIGAERRFLLADINSMTAAFALPTKGGTFGLSINYFGASTYNEQRIGLNYSRKLSEKFAIGAQLDYLGYSIQNYGNKALFTVEIGMMYKVNKALNIGIHLFNPVRQEVIEGEKVPTVMRIGAAYSPSKKVNIFGELEKDIDFDLQFKGGIEYFLIDILCLRAGVSTEPLLNSFGLGLKLKNGLRIDVASNYHYALGFTPGFSLSYQLK